MTRRTRSPSSTGPSRSSRPHDLVLVRRRPSRGLPGRPARGRWHDGSVRVRVSSGGPGGHLGMILPACLAIAPASCSIPGCGRPRSTRGWCRPHYLRYLRRGNILADAPIGRRDGRSRTRLYGIWHGMKARCYRPSHVAYASYGGRGVRVHPAWLASFEAFRRDVGEPLSAIHSLDRIDNDGHYEPGNVRWATPAEQMANRRRPTPQARAQRSAKLKAAAARRRAAFQNPSIECACGCGGVLAKFDEWKRPRRFITGHNLHAPGRQASRCDTEGGMPVTAFPGDRQAHPHTTRRA